MVSTYYIDESGNTGDLARPNALEFDGQPLFVLACVGCDDTQALAEEITRLKRVYKVQASELKSTALVNKPGFVTELAGFLGERKFPLLVEVVDKRFQIITYIVSLLILTPVGVEHDWAPKTRWMKNIFAEYLYHWMPQKVVDHYVGACAEPSARSIKRALNALKTWLARRESHEDIAGAINRFVRENIAELTDELRGNGEAYRRFLPVPDKSTRGTPLWMLPNLSSFANIYGRINMLHESKVGEITLVHDDQAHFEHILRDAKTLAEGLAAHGGEFVLPFSDFRYIETANLEFVESHASPGIQAADAVAGFVMRYVKSVMAAGQPDMEYRQAFDGLLRLSEPERCTGLNLVLTYADFERLGIRQAKV